MTVYGGTETVWGTKNGGFFVSCTKCGWHSKVKVGADLEDLGGVIFKCDKCGNEHRET